MTFAPKGAVWVADDRGTTRLHGDATSVRVDGSGTLALLDTTGRPVGYYAPGAWTYAGEEAPPQSGTLPTPPGAR